MAEIDSQLLTSNNVSALYSLKNAKDLEEVTSDKKLMLDSKSDVSQKPSEESNDKLISEVKDNLEKLNQFIPVTATNLSFEFDEKGNPPFIRVMDKDNNEVIREIPSEEFREVAKALDEFADKLSNKGFIFDKTV
jgi:flagellar protein FlaG